MTPLLLDMKEIGVLVFTVFGARERVTSGTFIELSFRKARRANAPVGIP